MNETERQGGARNEWVRSEKNQTQPFNKESENFVDARGNAVEDLESVMEAYRLAEVIARACKR